MEVEDCQFPFHFGKDLALALLVIRWRLVERQRESLCLQSEHRRGPVKTACTVTCAHSWGVV